MEREILFKAQRIDNGEWIVGDLIHAVDGLFIRQQNKPNLNVPIISKVNPETLVQFTGVTDKKDKKIFEGDIVKSDYGYGKPICVVEFNSIIYASIECQVSDDIEVIGNIYDNPELLNNKF